MKNLIAASLVAMVGLGSAVAGPVVVTPGSVAGYMYIEGSGGSSSVLPVVTENAACTATPSANTGINSTYTKIMTCVGGIWTSIGGAFWKNPVANYAGLPASGNTVGDVRLTTDTGRAFSWTGSAWKAMGLDQLGRLMTTGSTSTYGSVTVQGNGNNGWQGVNFKDTAGANSGTVMMHPGYSGFYNAADNNWRAYVTDDGNMVLGDQSVPAYGAVKGALNPGWAVETYPCATSGNGSIAKAAYDTVNGWAYSGVTLVCRAGVWARELAASCPSGYAYMGGSCQSVASYASSASGTVCGYWSDPNSWYGYGQALCQGHSPNVSCPAGYHQHYILQWSTNNYVCLKD